jgi:enoyl-CoA hydratase/carnithine racemase
MNPRDMVMGSRSILTDYGRPDPLVVDGTTDEFDGLVNETRDAQKALSSSPLLTVARVRGAPPRALGPVLELFDLVASGDETASERIVRRWREQHRVAPQATNLLAGLVRDGSSLLAESYVYSLLLSGDEHQGWLGDHPRRPAAVDPTPRVAVHMQAESCEIVLVRPSRHNAFDARMREELCDALDTCMARPGLSIGLRAEGPSFCSGGDLSEFGSLDDPVDAHFVRALRSVPARLHAIADRCVVALHGWCIGAGIELAAFASRVIAADNARVQLPEIAMGLIPGAGGTVSLPSRMGRRRFLELAMSGAVLDAADCLRLGLVDEVVRTPDLDTRFREVLHESASFSTKE